MKGSDHVHQEQRETQGIAESDASLVVTAVIALLAGVLLWRTRAGRIANNNSNTQSSNQIQNRNTVSSSQCLSPTCIRCHGEQAVENHLMQRFKGWIRESENLDDQTCPRVMSLVQSINHKDEILRTVYQESGYKAELSAMEPHIWTMPGLRRSPIWDVPDEKPLDFITVLFEEKQILETIRGEYEYISIQEDGWKTNTTPAGRWRVFHLFNQGVKVRENCQCCPETVRHLESLQGFMKGNVFGNAMFSSLEPGSHIETHTGPCNYRLRCHLPLVVPEGYCMRVGECAISWQVGKMLIFDDSYVHTVWHSQTRSNAQKRVLLIFDIWHPEVDGRERELINYIFQSSS